jgi:hypothetical protein
MTHVHSPHSFDAQTVVLNKTKQARFTSSHHPLLIGEAMVPQCHFVRRQVPQWLMPGVSTPRHLTVHVLEPTLPDLGELDTIW